VGYIDELFIAQNYRKKGIAKQLLKELEVFFLKKNCKLILTRTDWENKNAQELYSSFGMNKVTVEFWKEL
jgi:ribosomal protein S18 acetylase RimI-like enzyme